MQFEQHSLEKSTRQHRLAPNWHHMPVINEQIMARHWSMSSLFCSQQSLEMRSMREVGLHKDEQPSIFQRIVIIWNALDVFYSLFPISLLPPPWLSSIASRCIKTPLHLPLLHQSPQCSLLLSILSPQCLIFSHI